LDKSEVFALRLNRRKFAANSPDLIRRKFSIDGCFPGKVRGVGASTISKPYLAPDGNQPFTICGKSLVTGAAKPRKDSGFRRAAARLSVRLISL
jgi:hypothetical protein